MFWNIVTFQQSDHFADTQEYVEVVDIAETKEAKDLIVPNKIIYRVADGVYKGTQSMEEIKPIFGEIQKWEFKDFQSSINEFINKYKNTHAKQVLILQFPGDLPFELIKSMFKVSSNEIDSPIFNQYVFNNMYVFQDDIKNEEGTVYFATSDFDTVVQARVHWNYINDIKEKVTDGVGEPFHAEPRDGKEHLYVLDSQLSLQSYQYYPMLNDYEEFIKALFTNTNLVTQDGSVYTDNSSILTFMEDIKYFTYVDTTVPVTESPMHHMIMTSIRYINAHSGWTEEYYYSGVFPESNKVSFQLYSEGYPVFNMIGLSKIQLEIGNGKVYSYKRPYFNLTLPLEENTIELPSGQKVLAALKKSVIDIETIDDMVVGYKLETDEKHEIRLQPSWYYRIGDLWRRVSSDDLGGKSNGLE